MNNKDQIDNLKIRLSAYQTAELAILTGQEYSVGSRSLKRADLKEVRQAINQLQNQIARLENNNGKNKMVRVVPMDC